VTEPVTFGVSGRDENVDNGECVSCGLTVSYDEAREDWDEVCIRTKPYCTKSDDEHVDWRATYLNARDYSFKLRGLLIETCGIAMAWCRDPDDHARIAEIKKEAAL
jgi:hypothetical protein